MNSRSKVRAAVTYWVENNMEMTKWYGVLNVAKPLHMKHENIRKYSLHVTHNTASIAKSEDDSIDLDVDAYNDGSNIDKQGNSNNQSPFCAAKKHTEIRKALTMKAKRKETMSEEYIHDIFQFYLLGRGGK